MIEIIKFTTLGEQWIAVRDDSVHVGGQRSGRGGQSNGGDQVTYYPLGTTFTVDIDRESKQITPHVPALTDS